MERPDLTTDAVADRLRKLTPRELEVLSMIALGLSNSEIARCLFLSVHAVKYHVSSMYQKLGVTNRTEAAVIYLKAQGDPPERH
jgi:NarL family two-component system response regulator YdfI